MGALATSAGGFLLFRRRRTTRPPASPLLLPLQRPRAGSLPTASSSPLDAIVNPFVKKGFDYHTALLAAGFSFETYSEPKESRWERGSDGCDVAFVSDAFTASIYRGLLEVRLLECKDIQPELDGRERLLSGSGSDVFTLWAIIEDEGDAKTVADRYSQGVLDLQRAAHVGRSSTIWSNRKEDNGSYTPQGWGLGTYTWANEVLHLYVRNPEKAVLAVTLMDDEVLKAPDVIGATTVGLGDILDISAETRSPLAFLLSTAEGANSSEWEGWLPIKTRPPQNKDGQIAAAALMGGILGGPPGAMAAATLGALWEPQVQGQVRFRAKYLPLPPAADIPSPEELRRVSVTEGVDWHDLALRTATTSIFGTTAKHELCCVVAHRGTGCTALLYRDRAIRSVVVAFRGTCSLADIITDANLGQEPWLEGKKDCPERVHAGFQASLQSISRRLKELVVAAAEGSLEEWDMLVTGHSLGGALATLFVADIAEYGIDAGRGLPTAAPSEPWWGRLWAMPEALPPKPPRPRSLQLYTFGSPRVGNAEFAARFHSATAAIGADIYRVVNGADVVARVPRTMNAVISSVGYEHCGPTVLVSDDAEGCPLWVEGESEGECPLRDGTPLTNPFAKGNLLGDVYEVTRVAFSNGLTSPPVDALTPPPVGLTAGQLTLSDTPPVLPADLPLNPLEVMGRLGEVTTQWRQALDERVSRVSALEWATLVGLDHRYVRREMEMLGSLQSGEALQHHLEPAYFKAMRNVAIGKGIKL
jgi:hypothetical protein